MGGCSDFLSLVIPTFDYLYSPNGKEEIQCGSERKGEDV